MFSKCSGKDLRKIAKPKSSLHMQLYQECIILYEFLVISTPTSKAFIIGVGREWEGRREGRIGEGGEFPSFPHPPPQ